MERTPTLGTVLVALPVINLAAAAIYLAGYSQGFGSNVARYFTADDLFSTAISSLAPLYVLAALFGVSETRSLVARERAKIVAKTNIEASSSTGLTFRSSRKPLSWIPKFLSLVAAAISITCGLLQYLTGNVIDVMILAITLGMLFIVFTVEHAIYRAEDLTDQSAALQPILSWSNTFYGALLAALAVAIMGLTSGEDDRHRSYKADFGHEANCGKETVLRKAGSMYLTIGSGNRHHLVNDDCEIKLTLAAIKPQVPVGNLPRWVRVTFVTPSTSNDKFKD